MRVSCVVAIFSKIRIDLVYFKPLCSFIFGHTILWLTIHVWAVLFLSMLVFYWACAHRRFYGKCQFSVRFRCPFHLFPFLYVFRLERTNHGPFSHPFTFAVCKHIFFFFYILLHFALQPRNFYCLLFYVILYSSAKFLLMKMSHEKQWNGEERRNKS